MHDDFQEKPKPTKPFLFNIISFITVPGDGGSQLMAKLNKTTAVHFLCTYTTDYYFTLWLNLELLAPYFIDCTVDNLRLVYNPASKKTSNSPGVKTALPQFGDPDGVEFLDPSEIFVSSYYAPLGEALRAAGYENNKNLFGTAMTSEGSSYCNWISTLKGPTFTLMRLHLSTCGCSFRHHVMYEMQEYFTNLTKLIESSYAQNGKPALVVAHSLGNMVFTYFLSTMSQNWKDKYVAGYVAVAAPLGALLSSLDSMYPVSWSHLTNVIYI
ncbi:PLA2G15 [Bugula neritina]|uniref:PLA2G15 n=1 Tax=Bugula neritina TaxID=10212 RepID=A0A7J7JRE7_BUGNE|nr:PLA2G15 [Bugula neritina]